MSTPARSPKEAKTASKADVVEETDRGIVPLTNKDYDLDDLEMLTKSPLMVSPPSKFFINRVICRSGVWCYGGLWVSSHQEPRMLIS